MCTWWPLNDGEWFLQSAFNGFYLTVVVAWHSWYTRFDVVIII